MNSTQIGELLDDLQKRVDRCKVMFEQYFLGIQKRPPYQLQLELERKVRALTQAHIANTGLRFRFTTLSQKFASYNTYWKRTMRQIENGSYIRDIAKLGRDAVRLGKDVPEELLAKMPKRMRERILRDRAVVAEQAKRQDGREQELLESGKVRTNKRKNEHSLSADDDLDNLDLDSLFAEMQKPAESSSASSRSQSDTDIDQLFDDITNQDQPAPTPPSSRLASPHPGVPGRPGASGRPSVPSRRGGAGRPGPPIAPPRARASQVPPIPPRARARASQAPPIPKPANPRPSARQALPSERPSAPPPGMSVKEAQTLFKSYKKARELVGQDTSKLNYDRLMRSLNKQAPSILKQYNATAVKFDVVVKGDQVILKAKPEK